MATKVRLFIYRGFLSEKESDHLISLGKEISRINVNTEDASEKIQQSSSGYVLDLPDPIVAAIEERISAWTFIPRENSQPMKVRRSSYERAGQKLNYVGDEFRSESLEPLLATVILYLSTTTRGGQIIFPESQVWKGGIWTDCSKTGSIVRPVKGNAVLFFTRHLNGSLDQRSIHERCPVLEGEMWVATKLLFVRPAKGSRRSTEQEESECTDEEESCSSWAALGECQRNPVYMMGSDDYFGTCRKSCNAC